LAIGANANINKRYHDVIGRPDSSPIENVF